MPISVRVLVKVDANTKAAEGRGTRDEGRGTDEEEVAYSLSSLYVYKPTLL
jgi:hypothetical protein